MRQEKLRYNLQLFAENGDTSGNSAESTAKETDTLPDAATKDKETPSKEKETSEPETLEDILKDEKLNIYVLLEPDRSKVKITELSTYFPSLFSDMNVKDKEDKQQISNELALNKAKMEEFAYWHNRKRKGR